MKLSQKTRYAAAGLAVFMTLTLAGCGAPASEPEIGSTPQVSDTQDIGDWASAKYEKLGFAKAPEYDHLGIAYMNDHTGTLRDAYVPYGGNISLEDNRLQTTSHGVSMMIMFKNSASASAAVQSVKDEISEDSEASSIGSITWEEIQSADNDTVAVCPFTYEVGFNGQTHRVNCLIYADIKENAYMTMWLEYAPSLADDDTANLLAEIEDCYAITFPEAFYSES